MKEREFIHTCDLSGFFFEGHKNSGALIDPSARTALKKKKKKERNEKKKKHKNRSGRIYKLLDAMGRDGHLVASGHCMAVGIQQSQLFPVHWTGYKTDSGKG